MTQVHIRYEGQSWDFTMEQLDVGDLSTDAQVRQAVGLALEAQGVEVPRGKLDALRIDRNAQTGEMTLRPNAVFG